MSNKVFIGVISLFVIGVFVFVITDNKPKVPRPGQVLPDHGRQHVSQNAKLYGGSEPPASGDHAEPLKWGVYTQEVSDINTIHNLEHGGVYISYRPDLPKDQIEKINRLFGSPFSRIGFQPSKAIVAPRATNVSPIMMTSWNRELKLNSFEEQTMYNYYFYNIGKSPEPSAS